MPEILMGAFFITIPFISLIQLLATPKAPMTLMPGKVEIIPIAIFASSSKSLIGQFASMLLWLINIRLSTIPAIETYGSTFTEFSINAVNT
jgi:hypothetical protein